MALKLFQSAQGVASTAGGKGDDGDPGLSAYQIALANGFVGNEAAWLASLQGEAGDDSTIPGDDGLSAYEVWLADGNTGTESEFLASLQGANGSPSTDITVAVPNGTTRGYAIERDDLGFSSGLYCDDVGLVLEHPLGGAAFGRTQLPNESTLLTVGSLALRHLGAVLVLGRGEAKTYSLEPVSNAAPSGRTMHLWVETGAYAVTLAPAPGDQLNGSTSSIVLPPNTMSALYCNSSRGWRLHRFLDGALTATAVALPLALSALRLGPFAPRTTYFVEEWPAGIGSYWKPNAAGVLEPEGGMIPLYGRGSPVTFAPPGSAPFNVQRVCDVAKIGAGVLLPGYVIEARAVPTKTGSADELTSRFRLGANDSGAGDNVDLGTMRTQTTARVRPYVMRWMVVNDTTLRRSGGPSIDGVDVQGTNTEAAAAITLNAPLDGDLYLSHTVTLTSGSSDTIGSDNCLFTLRLGAR